MPTLRSRLFCATAVLLGSLTMITAAASPAAADGDEADGYATFVFAQYNGGSDSGSGTFGALPDCGPININGRKEFAKWSVGSSVADGATIEIGDEIELTATIFSRLTSNGNNGPDPLHVNLPLTGPLATAAPSVGTFPAGGLAHAGNDSTGPIGPLGPFGWSYDVNSDPSIIWPGDGAYVDLTVTIRATAPGQINLPRLEVAGFDETPSPGNFYCEIPINLNWTVDDVDPPTSGPDLAFTDASYAAEGFGDANGGAHTIEIDVLANDDDPEVPGVGGTDEVRITDWDNASVKGAAVSCGTPAEKSTTTFANMGAGPCTYTPPQGFSGSDSFRYVVQSISGLTKLVTVNVSVVRNLPPVIGNPEYVITDGDTIGDAPLANLIDDPDGDPVVCDFVGVDDGTGSVDGAACTFDYDPQGFTGETDFTVRVCDVNDLLVDANGELGQHVDKAPGYTVADPNGPTPVDDATSSTSQRCRDRTFPITVINDNEVLITPPIAGTDTDVVDAHDGGESEGPFTLRIPVVDNDIDATDPEFPDEIGGLDLLPGSLDPADGTVDFVVDEATDTYELLFTPAAGVEGQVEFQYRICDDPDVQNPPVVDPNPNDQIPNLGVCGVGTVSIFVVPNDPPLAEDDAVLTSSISPVVDFDAGSNDTDPQGETIECTPGPLVASPAGLVASASIDAACLVDLTPVVGAAGVAELTYEVCDVHALTHPDDPETPYGANGEQPGDIVDRCATAVVAATIVAPAIDDPDLFDFDPDPACAADVASTTAGTPIDIAVLANDSDLDLANAASPLTVSGAGVIDNEDVSAGGGVVLATADEQRVRYTPAAGFVGSDSFTYAAQDSVGQGCSATVTVTVAAVAGTGATAGGGALPRTGGLPGGLGQLQLGLGLAFLGLGLVLLSGMGRRVVARP
jgi:hypothetical protein